MYFEITKLDEIIEYLKDEQLMKSYLEAQKFICSEGNKEIETKSFSQLSPRSKSAYMSSLKDMLDDACESYIKNLVVYIFACFEELLLESVFLLLLKKNELLKKVEQINCDFKLNSAFELKYLLTTTYSKEIVHIVCDKASKYIVTGEIEKSINRFEKLAGVKFNKEAIKYLKLFQKKRNQIVHESKRIDLIHNFFQKFDDNLTSVFVTIKESFDKYDVAYDNPLEIS